MRIVLTNKSVNIAGGENYVLYLASELRKRNHYVIIAPLKDSELADKSKELGYETLEMKYSARGMDEIMLALDFANKLRAKKVDVIHTNSNTDRTIGALASKLLRCKNIAQIHSHFSVRQRIHHGLRNRLIDHFITDSHSSRNQLLNSDHLKESRVTAIHIGIPEISIPLPKHQRSLARKNLNIDDSEILISALGRMVPFKGHVYLLRAFKKILDRQTNTKLMIIGDGEIKEELLNECNQLNIIDRVIFPGYRTDTECLLPATDIFVHPSLVNGGESFPIAVLLALRSGLPIVATDVSDIPLQVVNGFNGYIVNSANTEMLAERISYLATHQDTRVKFGTNSIQHFKNNFTLSRMTDKTENLYYSLIREGINKSGKHCLLVGNKQHQNFLFTKIGADAPHLTIRD